MLTRVELQHALWPADTCVDVENGLNIAINKIRIALEDKGGEPRYIETLPRRGYRFIGTLVEPAPVDSLPPPTHATPDVVIGRAFPVRRLGPVALGASLAVAVVIVALMTTGTLVWRAKPAQSLAVLPFANLLGDHERDYAVEGLTHTLTTQLAEAENLRVIAPQSTARYEATDWRLRDIGRELGVQRLVLGSVVRDGASYVINVQVIDPETDQQLWVGRFARATLIELSSATDIVGALLVQLGVRRAAAHATSEQVVSHAAWDEYLRGRFYWNKRTPDGVAKAVTHLTRAITLEPNYALAWAGLADAYNNGATVRSEVITPWPGNSVDAGFMAVERALQLAPSLGPAHAARGKLLMARKQWAEAERSLADAVRLSPNYSPARQWYGTLLGRLQKCPAAIEQVEVGAALDPLTPIVNEAVGTTYAMCGDSERAVTKFRQVLDMHPDFAPTHMRLGNAYLRLGRFDEAERSFRASLQLAPQRCDTQARLSGALVALHKEEGQRLASDVIAHATDGYCIALAHAALGHNDGVFNALSAAYKAGDQLDGLLVDPMFANLRADARYRQLIEHVGLSEYAYGAQNGR
jgi:TolB-like protein/Flp pilus assembly protein TadD